LAKAANPPASERRTGDRRSLRYTGARCACTEIRPVMLGANIEGAQYSQNQAGDKFLLARDFGGNHEWTRMIQSQFRECERTRIRIAALALAHAEFFDH